MAGVVELATVGAQARQGFSILILTLAGCTPACARCRSISGTNWRSLAAVAAL